MPELNSLWHKFSSECAGDPLAHRVLGAPGVQCDCPRLAGVKNYFVSGGGDSSTKKWKRVKNNCNGVRVKRCTDVDCRHKNEKVQFLSPVGQSRAQGASPSAQL